MKGAYKKFKLPKIKVGKELGAELLWWLITFQNEKYRSICEEFSADEETLFLLALTFHRPDRKEEAMKQIIRYKPHVKNPQRLRKILMECLSKVDLGTVKVSPEISKWKEKIPELKKRIKRVIDYFKPRPDTSPIDIIVLVPSNRMVSKTSGKSFRFGRELLIMSHSENLDNVEHEFLHGLINPIIEKVRLSQEQKKRIVKLAGQKLKRDYGEYPLSLLAEQFIRVYNDLIKKGRKPRKFKEFKQGLATLTEREFQKVKQSNGKLRKRLKEMEISSLEQLRKKAKEYYNRYLKDELEQRIFKLYLKYERMKRDDFEGFLKENLKNLYRPSV